MKKILSLILSLAMVATMCVSMGITAFAADGAYTVAGDAALTEAAWDPSQNPMTYGEYTFNNNAYDYVKTFSSIQSNIYSFNITDGTWNNKWGMGDKTYTFELSNTCDVTIYFNSQTKAIAVDAEFLKDLTIDSVTAIGNGSGNWLNGTLWDSTDKLNDLTEKEPGVWKITYTDVAASDNYQIEFAINHNASYYWGADGLIDGNLIMFSVPKDGSTVELTIDINGYNVADKTGNAQITINVIPPNEAITAVGGTKSTEVKGTYQAGATAATVYSVDVTWGSMEFTYTDGSAGTWNPATHAYDGMAAGAWTNAADANKITVTNHSNAAVDATLTYATETNFSAVSGTFTEASGTANDNKLALATADGTALANAPTASAALNLSGDLTAGVTNAKIGTVTVTITAHTSGASADDAQDGGIYGRE